MAVEGRISPGSSIETAEIANNAVTLAKLATMATDSFMGRDTAGTGNVEVLSAATAASILSTAFTSISGLTSFSFAAPYDNGNSGTTKTITYANGNEQKVTITGSCTFTLTAPGGGIPFYMRLTMTIDGTGGYTAPVFTGAHYSNNTAPSWGMGASDTNVAILYYNGTNWYISGLTDTDAPA